MPSELMLLEAARTGCWEGGGVGENVAGHDLRVLDPNRLSRLHIISGFLFCKYTFSKIGLVIVRKKFQSERIRLPNAPEPFSSCNSDKMHCFNTKNLQNLSRFATQTNCIVLILKTNKIRV